MMCFAISAISSSAVSIVFFFFSSRRRHTRFKCDWSSDVCSSDLAALGRCLLRTGAVAGAEEAAAEGGVNMFTEQEGWDVLEDIPNDSAAALILQIGRASCRERV